MLYSSYGVGNGVIKTACKCGAFCMFSSDSESIAKDGRNA
uniref:Uncharacterized protein n=1 Tax=Anguilla anguilla TaxID=7936 RepID=A0A0E9TSS6_ANGAN